MKSFEELLEIARGNIYKQKIELVIDGVSQKFEGSEAVIFSIGILSGMKIAEDEDNCTLNTNVVDKFCRASV